MSGAAWLLLVLYLAPVLGSFCLPDPRSLVPWHQARRDPTGLSPDPAVTQEPVIQVFTAPAVAWRGLEVNLLGLSLGVDPVRPALKLPALGRLGMMRL